MKKITNFAAAAVLMAGLSAFSAPAAVAEDWACIKNVGGGALMKAFLYTYRHIRYNHTPAFPVGVTACFDVRQVPVGTTYLIRVDNVALERGPEVVGPAKRRSGGAKYVSWAATASVFQATKKGGPYRWNNCNHSCRYYDKYYQAVR
ncbi:MAG: hypothetical protein HAW59_01970 [Betaproteobacteria bacterium]|nr:hypothetical protein [Betaproteobacteria bacterium]